MQPAIILAGHEDEAVRRGDPVGERIHRRGGFAHREIAVPPVEHRQVHRHRIDQFGAVAARSKGIDDPAGKLDALPVAAIASVEDQDGAAHRPIVPRRAAERKRVLRRTGRQF